MKVFTVSLFLVAILSASKAAPSWFEDEPGCKSPTGEGLQPALDELLKLLPVDKLTEIYVTAVSSDPEVQQAMEYIQSDDFKNIILAIQKAPNFYNIMDYACEKLYFDAYFYYNQLAQIFDLPIITKPPFYVLSERTDVYRRPGLKGMFLDMYEVIPVDKIKELYEHKVQTDKYVKDGMNLLASEKVKQIVKIVEGLDEYKKFLNEFRGMNIDVDDIIAAIKKFFGWD